MAGVEPWEWKNHSPLHVDDRGGRLVERLDRGPPLDVCPVAVRCEGEWAGSGKREAGDVLEAMAATGLLHSDQLAVRGSAAPEAAQLAALGLVFDPGGVVADPGEPASGVDQQCPNDLCGRGDLMTH